MKRTGFFISFLIITAAFFALQLCNPPEPSGNIKPEKFWREQNEKELFSLQQKYEKSLSTLQTINNSLKKELTVTKSKLKSSKLKQHLSEVKILALAEKDSGNNVVEELSKCDSLKAEVISYIHQVDSTEALYDSTIVQLENLLAIKDTSLIVCKASYDQLKEITEDNLRRELRLTADLEQAIKVQKRKTLQNKLLAGGFLILSGILTSILIIKK